MATQTKSAAQLDHESTTKSQLYGIDITFTLLAVIAVCLRFWARHWSAGSYGWDDWLVLASLFLVFINLALNAVMIENGLGLQATDVPLESLMMIGKAIFGDEIVYVVVLAVIKIAILVMYCRVFPLRSFHIAAWILSVVTCLWSLMFIFLCIFQCSPIPRAWNLTIPGKCLNLRAIYIGNAVPNITTDAAILLMPLYHVWHLHIRTAQRFAVTGIFLLGAFVIVASIYRFTKILKLDPMNLSYTLEQPTTWSHVEVSVALICSCLPMMRPLLTAFLNFVGLNKTSQHGKASEYNEGRGPSEYSRSRKKKPSTGLTTEFSVLNEGRDGWSTPTNAESTDEWPLKGIQVQKEFEQVVETIPKAERSPKPDEWVDDRKGSSWYPGS